VIKFLGYEIASLHSVCESRKEIRESMHKHQLDQEQIEERLARLERVMEQKADRDDLEKLREDVGDLQGQLADAESRVDDLENADWT
jgi:predicted nuclease with TOPRIM domain